MFFEDDEEKQPDAVPELEYQNFLDDLREVTKTPAGKRVFWKLLEYAGIHHSVYDANVQEMCRNEGRREFGLWIEETLDRVDPDLIYQIAKEKVNVRSDR
mgnify:FL=1